MITNEIIQQYTDQQTYSKYRQFLSDYLIQQDQLKKWCPNVHCAKVIQFQSRDQKEAQCQNCQQVICTLCGQEAHPTQTCQEVAEKQLEALTEARDLQRCRNCHSLVQKFSGCNHMTW